MLAKVSIKGKIVPVEKFEVLTELIPIEEFKHTRVVVKEETDPLLPKSYPQALYDWSENAPEGYVISDALKNVECDNVVADVDQLLTIMPDLDVVVHRVYESEDRIGRQISALHSAINNHYKALVTFKEEMDFNSKCEVHVANLGLLNINETKLLSDGCTDELQEMLNDGWRIVAVAPQPGQRRPDYILGRFNPNL